MNNKDDLKIKTMRFVMTLKSSRSKFNKEKFIEDRLNSMPGIYQTSQNAWHKEILQM